MTDSEERRVHVKLYIYIGAEDFISKVCNI